jgi:hypothetical protein
VAIFEKTFNEYAYDDKNVLKLYKHIHKRIKVLSNSGIEDNNKVYIPFNDEDKVIYEKARVIKPNGNILELNKKDIVEAYDEESKQTYRYFAINGIEIGDEIEYLYYIERESYLQGSLFTIQSSYPIMSFEYRFITPVNLFLKFKSFNKCPDIILDTTQKKCNYWILKVDSIPKLIDEESSALNANKMKIAMKLDKNTANGKKDIYSYGSISQTIYSNIYNSIDPKDIKSLKKLCKSIKLDESSEESKIRSIENYIKSNFVYVDAEASELVNLSSILSNKVFNSFGGVRLFANIFQTLDIEHEIVLTSDRFEKKFDKDYENYSFLEDYLIYFPTIKKFMNPSDNFTRLGFPPEANICNYGLFIKGIKMGEYNTGIGKIKYIAGNAVNENEDNLKVVASIPTDFQDIKYEITRSMTGYVASAYQPYFDYIKDEAKLKEFSESIINYIDNEGTIENLEIKNKKGNDLGANPLITTASLTSSAFFDKAGDKYIFKVGLLIGPQMELYKKEERKLPLEFPYNRSYTRILVFNIPDGYKIQNLEQLKMSELYIKNASDTTMAFYSDYKVEENQVTVECKEYYKEYLYDVKEYEDYRRVANASANFNKLAVYFEKK